MCAQKDGIFVGNLQDLVLFFRLPKLRERHFNAREHVAHRAQGQSQHRIGISVDAGNHGRAVSFERECAGHLQWLTGGHIVSDDRVRDVGEGYCGTDGFLQDPVHSAIEQCDDAVATVQLAGGTTLGLPPFDSGLGDVGFAIGAPVVFKDRVGGDDIRRYLCPIFGQETMCDGVGLDRKSVV